MAGAHHRSEMTTPLIRIDRFASERTDALAPRERQRRLECTFLRCLAHRGRGFRIDSRAAQRRRDPLRTIAASRQSGAARLGEERIVDIAKLRTTLDNRVQRGLLVPLPASL